MVDSLDEEELNRLLSYLDLTTIETEEDFWDAYWEEFNMKGSTKMGDRLKDHYEEKEDVKLPSKPKRRIVFIDGKQYVIVERD